MSNRPLRFGIALLAIAAATAAGYRVFQQEQQLSQTILATRQAELSTESALVTISELKAALHAYVAEGQGEAFWTARAATLIDGLRASILELDATATAAGQSLTEALDIADRVGVAEQRAREHVRDGQRLLAGEVIFTEARDLLESMRLQIATARTAVANTGGQTASAIRREQAIVATAAAGILAFATLLLVVPAVRPVEGIANEEHTDAAVDDTDSTRLVTLPATVDPKRGSGVRPAVVETPHAIGSATREPGRTTGSGTRITPREIDSAVRKAAAAQGAASPPPISLREAAAVCTDLGRVSQSIEIAALLDRAAKVLTASGAIVWMASPDGREMYPAASAGYDERLLNRIGAIARDASNVTAAAFRDASPRTSPSIGSSAAALAVPLMTPLGPVGVFSAEIREVVTVDEARLAVATIFAAQLASLLGSMATSTGDAVPGMAPAAKAQA
jgi:hypothetical protein